MKAVLGEFAGMAHELRGENGYETVVLVANEVGGLRMLYLAALPAPGGRVSRDFFTERWSTGPLFVAIYDDQHGIFLWEHVRPDAPTEGILTDGHRVGLSGIEPSVDYAQKGFTPAQLDAAFQKPEEQLTDQEARALMEPTDALTIGLGHYGFGAKRSDFLALVRAEKAWSLLEDQPSEQAMPRDAGPIVSFYVEPYEWSGYELPVRNY